MGLQMSSNTNTNASRLTTGAKVAFGAALYTQLIAAGLETKILAASCQLNPPTNVTEILETQVVISGKALTSLILFNLGSLALLGIGLKMKGPDPSAPLRKPDGGNNCSLG
jgi:hypothetical protein